MAHIGLQLIVFGRKVQEAFEETLAAVAAAGYEGFESGNLFKAFGEQRTRDALAASGLAVAGVHTGYDDTVDLAKVEENLSFLEAVGGRYLINSGVPEGEGPERYEQAAEVFNRVGALARQRGITFCYHNHNWEFEQLDGAKGIHLLARLTDSELVKFNVDVYWVTVGGENPVEFIERYRDRVGYYHFKDGMPGDFIELGQGMVDIEGCLEKSLQLDADWLVVEQDQTKLDPAKSVRISREYLRELGV